jgi:hypothetical protein
MAVKLQPKESDYLRVPIALGIRKELSVHLFDELLVT